MRAANIFTRPKTALFALAGLGLAAGFVVVADRPAGGEARGTASLCTKLNVGDDACGHAYLTKAGFDRVFADVAKASTLNAQDRAIFAEKLRLDGARRLAPMTPGERITIVRTRTVEASHVPLHVGTALQTTRLDHAAVFRMMLEGPTGAVTDQRMSTNTTVSAADGS